MRGALLIGLIIGVPVALIVVGVVGLALSLPSSLPTLDLAALEELVAPEPSGSPAPREAEEDERAAAQASEPETEAGAESTSSTAAPRVIDATPKEAVESFLQALFDRDLPRARALLAESERAVEPMLNTHGWFLEETLARRCEDGAYAASYRLAPGTHSVDVTVHYPSCDGDARQNAEQRLTLHLSQNAEGAFRVGLGWKAYADAVQSAPPPTPYLDFVSVTHFEHVRLPDDRQGFAVGLKNEGERTLTDLAMTLLCQPPSGEPSPVMYVRAVDASAARLSSSGAQHMAAPLAPGETRDFVTQLSPAAVQCQGETYGLTMSGARLSAPVGAKRWRLRGKTCGKPVGKGGTRLALVLPSGDVVEVGARCRIGKGPANDLMLLGDDTLAPQHAVIALRDGKHVVSRLHDTHPVLLDDVAVTQRALEGDAQLRLGATRLIVRALQRP